MPGMGSVAHIGPCLVCKKMARLREDSCEECDGKYHPMAGEIMERARRDHEFARKCLESLTHEGARQRFIELVGPIPDRVPGARLV